MDCANFDAKADLYFDERLSASEMADASLHTKTCASCSEIVAGYQKARELLRTAVTQRVAAVDVSGMWERIEGSLAEPVQVTRRRWLEIAAARAGDLADRARMFLVGGFTPARAGLWAAAAAGIVFMIAMQVTETKSVNVASRDIAVLRPVRIDSMEVAAGHTVTTWVRPKTRTRVIWVGDQGSFSVSNASHNP